ncbi:hypothetical protein [Ideonella sp. A 288]|uniref:hypothetical protein n=1 Tax=Ideonella sp. A 288 TaxID=1962181 RepID=UPI000B4BCBB9|nr:hypothetical protein [Ideonella sp. A 288]
MITRWLWRGLLVVLSAVLAVLLLGALVGSVVLQGQPEVARAADVSVLDLARAARLLRSIDPRRQAGEGVRELAMTQREVDLLLDQIAQRSAPAAARATLQPRRLRLQASIGTRGWMAGRWLNIDLTLRDTEALPLIERLRIGRVPVPGWLGEWALRQVAAWQFGPDQVLLARDVVRGMAFDTGQVSVRYVWRADLAGRLVGSMMAAPEQDRLRVYVEQLATLKLKSVAGGRIPMVQLMPTVFALAAQRSGVEGADAAQENRAAILAMAFASHPRQLVSVVPAARRWRLPPPWRLTMAGRDDFPLHFLISAALAVEAGGPLSDAIGLFKEVNDARVGSGFSFTDVAVDRAGTRFGLAALRQPQRLQRALAAGVTDADLMPEVSDLPEFMKPPEFNQRYGSVGSPAYQRQLADIDARLDRLPMYR